MKMNHGIFVAFLVGAFALSSIASPNASPSKSDSSRIQKKWDDLGLNQNQKDQMKALRTENKDGMKTQFEAMKALHQKIKDEFLKSNPDPAVIDSYSDQLLQIQKQMMKNRDSNLFKVKQILTPDQFKKFLDMQQKRFRGFHGKKGHSDTDQ